MANFKPTAWQWIHSLLEPAFILQMAMSYYVKANIRAILQGHILAPILDAQRLRDEAFGEFWIAFSSYREAAAAAAKAAAATHPPSQDATPQPAPFPSDLMPRILSHAKGLVLDVGPGTGAQMPLLTSPAIKAIYGPEPCLRLHPEIRKRAEKEGISGKYTVLPCSVVGRELGGELERHGLISSGEGGKPKDGEGVFDTIITIRVLCSVPELPTTASELYKLLKPGGKLLVVEHVVNRWRSAKGSLTARVFQSLYHALGWRWVMGDCSMDRDIEGVVRTAPGEEGWESVDVERFGEESCMPHLAGVFVKRG
ncbi:hypothetical protein BDV12DRAFT_30501 [Aspergillus spectabilis]